MPSVRRWAWRRSGHRWRREAGLSDCAHRGSLSPSVAGECRGAASRAPSLTIGRWSASKRRQSRSSSCRGCQLLSAPRERSAGRASDAWLVERRHPTAVGRTVHPTEHRRRGKEERRRRNAGRRPSQRPAGRRDCRGQEGRGRRDSPSRGHLRLSALLNACGRNVRRLVAGRPGEDLMAPEEQVSESCANPEQNRRFVSCPLPPATDLDAARCSERACARLQVDIGFGDVITPEASDIEYPPLLDFPAPRLRAYPR
jgi:hypothetical protein